MFCRWPIGERLGIGLEAMVMVEENRPSICSFLSKIIFLYPSLEMFFNYLPLTNGQMVPPKPRGFALSCMRRYCANVKLSSGLFLFLFFNIVNARPDLPVLVPPIDFVFVCADLRLLCCSCFGGVSPVQLVFSVCCDC